MFGGFTMNAELELKMNEWLSNECATEHPLDNRRYYEFVSTSLVVGEKVEQYVYECKINLYRQHNPFLHDEWIKKYNYSLYEELYYFGMFMQSR